MDLIHQALCVDLKHKSDLPKYLSEEGQKRLRQYGEPDAGAILVYLRKTSRRYGNPKDLSDAAKFLLAVRNKWAHQQPISAEDENGAFLSARTLLTIAGKTSAANIATDLDPKREPKEIEDLRQMLISRVKLASPTLTYAQALAALGWSASKPALNRLIRALNALGGWQRAIGEPALCALVVLGNDEAPTLEEVGIPGRGFYWLVDLQTDAPVTQKKLWHSRELGRVAKYKWKN